MSDKPPFDTLEPKRSREGAREGAPLLQDHVLRATERAFDDFAGQGSDRAFNRRWLAIS